MTDATDAINVLSLESWNATDTTLLSYLKTPIQQTFFNNNSDLIGKALRQSIIYFAKTLNNLDRSSCILGNEFRSTRTHKYQVLHPTDEKTSAPTTPMEVTTFAPIVFEYLREIIGITRSDFQASFANGELINFANTGKSGSQMFKTQDDVYVIKTLRDHEAKLLIQTLSGLYLRYSHTCSLMTRYIGLYSVNIRSIFPSEIFCVVMVNNLPSFLDIHEIYDLKGSSKNRHSSIDLTSRRLKALKDEDFTSFYPFGIRIPHEIYRRLKKSLEIDIFELKKMMITDFSLMVGVHQLDGNLQNEENNQGNLRLQAIPQLGISTLLSVANIDRTAIQSNQPEALNEESKVLQRKLINKFIMKPLHLIGCPHEDTFNDSSMASSLLGIPGVTHEGRRVLLYPAFIDCLQTFDNFKRMQHAIQNIRDPKRSAEYSVIHPDEYEKRLLRFLFDRVFIDSQQTLDELLSSPTISDNIYQNGSTTTSLDDAEEEYENRNGRSNEPRESFEIIQFSNIQNVVLNNETISRTADILQNLTIQPLATTDNDKMYIESTSL